MSMAVKALIVCRMSEEMSDEVVVLRQWLTADAATIVDCEEAIAWWLDRGPQPYTVADALGYIRDAGEDKYAIADAETGDVLGSVALTWRETRDVAEVGYWLRSEARGRGVMTRALRMI